MTVTFRVYRLYRIFHNARATRPICRDRAAIAAKERQTAFEAGYDERYTNVANGIRMRYLIFALPSLFVATQPCGAWEQPRVVVQNNLSHCLSISVTDISNGSGPVTAMADTRLREPIGACGCFSSRAIYRSTIEIGGTSERLQEGLIDLRSGGRKIFVLATEPKLIEGAETRLHVGCAPPS